MSGVHLAAGPVTYECPECTGVHTSPLAAALCCDPAYDPDVT